MFAKRSVDKRDDNLRCVSLKWSTDDGKHYNLSLYIEISDQESQGFKEWLGREHLKLYKTF